MYEQKYSGIFDSHAHYDDSRFDGDRDKDGHSDRFWGAALCRGAKGKKSTPAGASTADLERDVFDNAGGRSRRSFM